MRRKQNRARPREDSGSSGQSSPDESLVAAFLFAPFVPVLRVDDRKRPAAVPRPACARYSETLHRARRADSKRVSGPGGRETFRAVRAEVRAKRRAAPRQPQPSKRRDALTAASTRKRSPSAGGQAA